MSKKELELKRAKSPESVGVSSSEILRFFEDMEKNDLEVHSLMVVRNGEVACECYRYPFAADLPHTMYSVSKSWIATAIGLACDEKLITLNTRVADIFPEKMPLETDLYLEKLTVGHLVSMQGGKNPSLLADKSKINWLDYYFNCPWSFEPGKDYLYVNENMYVLAKIINRVTGMTVNEYLKPRLYDPLGIDVPFWEMDADKVEAGGWGLYVTTEDLMKLMLCYHNGGVYQGKQVLPAWWVKEATSVIADNSANKEIDDQGGYGYGFWTNVTCPDSYRCNGMFSQLGIVFKEYDAVVVITSAIPQIQQGCDLIWRHFPAAFIEKDSEKTVEDFAEKIKSYPIDKPKSSFHSSMEKQLVGKTICVNKNLLLNAIGFPVSMLPLAVTYMTTDKAGNVDKIQLAFGDNYMKMRWTEGDEINTICAGTDGVLRSSEMTLGTISYKVFSSAYWESEEVLIVEVRPVTTIAKRILRFEFHGNRVEIIPSSTPSVHKIADFLGCVAYDLIKNENLLKAVPPFLKFVEVAVEPKMHGRLV